MGEVGHHRPVHLEVDLDRGSAEFGMGGRAVIGVWQAARMGDVPGEFDDALVVDVVQHEARSWRRNPPSALQRPWRVGLAILYMDANAGKTVRPFWPAPVLISRWDS